MKTLSDLKRGDDVIWKPYTSALNKIETLEDGRPFLTQDPVVDGSLRPAAVEAIKIADSAIYKMMGV